MTEPSIPAVDSATLVPGAPAAAGSQGGTGTLPDGSVSAAGREVRLADLRPLGLFTGTDDEPLAQLAAVATQVRFGAGDVLFHEAEPADFWWVLLDGRVDLVRHVGREETLLGAMDVPGRWAGGFRAWDDQGVYVATGRASEAGRILRVPAPALRDWSGTWFPVGAHIIEGVFRTARRFESEARQREALVALGTLAAGLAHEINNPAAAATRAVDDLAGACDVLVSSVGRLASGSIGPDRLAALDALRREVGPAAVAGDPLVAADREDALAEWLADHGVPEEWVMAAALAAAGIDVAWCERAAEVLGDEALEPGLEWVAGTLTATALLAEVKDATRRISDLVSAVKSYSQLDRASVQRTDVAEGLDSTLVMLGYRIPDGVTVVRDHGPGVPMIEAVAGELNQVWTNLIGNALDAMGGTGTLRVSTRAAGTGVVVEIGDTGPGMSDETRKHAFDPFYTTKGVGEGTGLGLDISRRIVDRHRGEITVERRPGETVLRVRLPSGRTGPRPDGGLRPPA